MRFEHRAVVWLVAIPFGVACVALLVIGALR